MSGLKSRPETSGIPGGKGRSSLLKTVFLSGIILALLILGILAAVSLIRPGDSPPESRGFFQGLRDYDQAPRGSGPEFLSRKLDGLEKEALGVEAYLSVLKRRRALAGADPRFLAQYRESARRAAAAYPYSEPLAAIAAAALVQGRALTAAGAEELGRYLPVLGSGSFYPLRLSLHVLRGDFKDPLTAAETPSLTAVLGGALPRLRGRIPSGAGESLAACLTILKTLEGGAEREEIQGIIAGALGPEASAEFIRFAGEYFYDFREPLRAAELFSRLDTEEDLGRQADALWLAGQYAAAWNIWALLASPVGETPPPARTAARSLYNLALYAAGPEEAAARYKQLLALDFAGDEALSPQAAQSLIYGTIRYSRVENAPLALAVLEEGIKRFPGEALLDLELLKRRGEFQEPDRVVAETWRLLGRYPGAGELYRWAAWYFDFQRRPGETALVLKNAARQGMNAPWISLHEALALIYAGNLYGAEEILRALPPEAAGWEVLANRGRIHEALRAPAAALEYYETAAALARDPKDAARLQVSLARCLRALGRGREIRRVLEYALDLDPGNLKARLELDRLPPGGF
jgi:tetratricopeptide (TPR) repeat protein